jgi:hypothetical protein
LSFNRRFASVKVEPNDADEREATNFPRNLHNAAELFAALGHAESARQLHASVTAVLDVLVAGPDGKSKQRLGRACVCWACGHVGIPANSAECAEAGAVPPGACASCGDAGQTNFVRLVGTDGVTVPWIQMGAEPAPPQGQSGNRVEAAGP